jgi:hypothetical protein
MSLLGLRQDSIDLLFRHQVKTRMQLDTGKSRHGLVGTLSAIVKEEGYVKEGSREQRVNPIFMYIELAACIEVRVSYPSACHI